MATAPISPIDRAKDIFMYAESFSAAAETLAKRGNELAKSKDKDKMTLSLDECAPIAVVDSFATELYLKSLHWIDHGRAPTKKLHTFCDIFDALLSATKASIKTWYNQARDGQYVAMRDQLSRDKPDFDHSFENCLRLSSDTFTKIRYGFEGINVQIFYWPPLRVAVRNVIASTYPGWSWASKK